MAALVGDDGIFFTGTEISSFKTDQSRIKPSSCKLITPISSLWLHGKYTVAGQGAVLRTESAPEGDIDEGGRLAEGGEPPPPLPEGWHEAVDEETGHVYFYSDRRREAKHGLREIWRDFYSTQVPRRASHIIT